MVEIFKTNVENQEQAHMLVSLIQNIFSGYQANFDLEDCDRILRVESRSKSMDTKSLMTLLRDFGVRAEVLSDEPLWPVSRTKQII